MNSLLDIDIDCLIDWLLLVINLLPRNDDAHESHDAEKNPALCLSAVEMQHVNGYGQSEAILE